MCHRWLLIGCALYCFQCFVGGATAKWRAVTWLVDPQRVDLWTVGFAMANEIRCA